MNATTHKPLLEIPLDQLHDSPFQPRAGYPEAALAELAENIKAEGRIHTPLLVRPCPSLNSLQPGWAMSDGYEIVAGHRRRRAAAIAGLATAPCIVRTLTDAEARRAAYSENVPRANLNALEEATSLHAMKEAEGLTVADLVKRTGKSEAFVYGRLKLLDMAPPVRDDFVKGEIVAEIALLFARHEPALQVKALEKLKSSRFYHARGGRTDGGKDGYRAMRDFLAEYFMLDLKEALWKLDDAELLPLAGACTACPKRTGATPALFGDVVAAGLAGKRGRQAAGLDDDGEFSYRARKGPNVCTDPDCFGEKKKAHLKRAQAALEAKGETVIAGAKARQIVSAQGEIKGGYISLADAKKLIKDRKTLGGKPLAETIATIVQDPRDGKPHKVVKVDDLQAAGVKGAAPKAVGNDLAARKRDEEQSAKTKALAEAERKVRAEVFRRVRTALAATPRTAADLALAARVALEGSGYHGRPVLMRAYGQHNLDGLAKALGSMPAAALGAFLVECAIANDATVDDWGFKPGQSLGVLGDVAARYGIDVKAIRAEAAGKTASSATSDAGEEQEEAA